MTMALGKRKRQPRSGTSTTATPSSKQILGLDSQSPPSDEDSDRARVLFQRAFEAKFQPLGQAVRSPGREGIPDEGDDSLEGDAVVDQEDEDSDWSGLSNPKQGTVEIVEIPRTSEPLEEERRRGRKGFMSSKPPSSSDSIRGEPNKALVKNGESDLDGSETANLKHDLALQRLLKESHLLDPASFHSSSLEPQGKTRLKALDMRIRDLGAKKSVLQQEKMPMSHRKGIIAKAADREVTRRREAMENGIVLEKARKTGKPSAQKRMRGVGDPTVGKFKGGTLRLSAKDVTSIEGRKMNGFGRRKGKR